VIKGLNRCFPVSGIVAIGTGLGDLSPVYIFMATFAGLVQSQEGSIQDRKTSVFLGPGNNRFPGNKFPGVAFGTLQGTVLSFQFIPSFIMVEIVNIFRPVHQFKFPAIVIGMTGTAILLFFLMVSFSRVNAFF